MKIQINYSGIESSDALTAHINDRVEHAMRHHGKHFSRVEQLDELATRVTYRLRSA